METLKETIFNLVKEREHVTFAELQNIQNFGAGDFALEARANSNIFYWVITYATINDNEIDFDNPDTSEIFNGVIYQTIGSCHIIIPQEGMVFIIDNIKLKSDHPEEDIYNIMSKYISGLSPGSIGLVKILEPETVKKCSNYELIRTKVIYGILIDAEPGQIELDKNPSKHLGLN